MPDSVKTRGLPVPRAHEVLLLAGLCALGWWGWSEFGQRQVRQRLWNAEATVVERDRAIEAFVVQGAAAVPELIRNLMADDPRHRADAARALGSIGATANSAARELKRALNDPDSDVRKAVARSLPQITPDDPEVVDLLIKVLIADDNASIREAAAIAIGTLGETAIPSLVSQMNDAQPDIRRNGVLLMYRVAMSSRLEGEFPEVVKALWSCAEDLDFSTRDHAILTLLQMHRAPQEKVVEWMHETNPLVVFRSLEALPWLDIDRVALLPDLICVLEASQANPQTGPFDPYQKAWMLLTELGAESKVAAPALVRLFLGEENSSRRVSLYYFLAEITADRDTLLPAVISALEDATLSRRAGALLERIAPDEAARQTALLMPRLDDPDEGKAWIALGALFAMRTVAVAAAPELAELLPDDGPSFMALSQRRSSRAGPAGH